MVKGKDAQSKVRVEKGGEMRERKIRGRNEKRGRWRDSPRRVVSRVEGPCDIPRLGIPTILIKRNKKIIQKKRRRKTRIKRKRFSLRENNGCMVKKKQKH